MLIRWPWQKRERRSSASGFTAEIMAARESYISGRRGIGELTATVQTCISMWEHGLSLADVKGTAMLTPHILAMTARSLALRGEAAFVIDTNRLLPASDWDISTRNGVPRAYRLSISEAGGGRAETRLAAEVLHIRIGSDVAAPWTGTAPLRRASITAGFLQAIETALSEVYETAPLGSLIVPFPESPNTDTEQLSRGFRGRRGSVLLRESVSVTAAGGPVPQVDWKPDSLSPDLASAMTSESLAAAREAIGSAFGVLPAVLNAACTGPMVREAQRHLAAWVLQPIAALLAREASEKLGTDIILDVTRPLQSFDTAGRARALGAIVNALADAKERGLDPADVEKALALVDWDAE